MGTGIPLRASVERFGPVLLSKVLDLNDTQESSLGLVFHYAQTKQLPLVTLADLRAVLSYLTCAAGKGELAGIGGLSSQTAGVILRELVTLSNQGADVFFGEPQVDVADFLRTTSDGKGIVSMLELAGVQDKPLIFSTFLMWLLTELYRLLPEVGDQDKPKLVFFFDEAHLLFAGASKAFVQTVTQTVRLIRSKGVGIFFVTQTPKDVPGDVLAQLGSRIQHALRAYTPDDAKALKATVSTYPKSEYALGEVLTQLGTGEAIVTVMNEKGAPTPVAWTRMRAPEGSMEPAPADSIATAINGSALLPKYSQPATTRGAAELLGAQLDAAAEPATTPAEREPKRSEQRPAERSGSTKSAPRTTSRSRAKDSVGETVIKNVVKAATSATVINTVLKAILKKK